MSLFSCTRTKALSKSVHNICKVWHPEGYIKAQLCFIAPFQPFFFIICLNTLKNCLSVAIHLSTFAIQQESNVSPYTSAENLSNWLASSPYKPYFKWLFLYKQIFLFFLFFLLQKMHYWLLQVNNDVTFWNAHYGNNVHIAIELGLITAYIKITR